MCLTSTEHGLEGKTDEEFDCGREEGEEGIGCWCQDGIDG